MEPHMNPSSTRECLTALISNPVLSDFVVSELVIQFMKKVLSHNDNLMKKLNFDDDIVGQKCRIAENGEIFVTFKNGETKQFNLASYMEWYDVTLMEKDEIFIAFNNATDEDKAILLSVDGLPKLQNPPNSSVYRRTMNSCLFDTNIEDGSVYETVFTHTLLINYHEHKAIEEKRIRDAVPIKPLTILQRKDVLILPMLNEAGRILKTTSKQEPESAPEPEPEMVEYYENIRKAVDAATTTEEKIAASEGFVLYMNFEQTGMKLSPGIKLSPMPKLKHGERFAGFSITKIGDIPQDYYLLHPVLHEGKCYY